MHLTLVREIYSPMSTIGSLLVDGSFECFTLEDVVRAPGIKVPGATAIPTGSYQVIIDYSVRFRRMMPHVLDVPLFEGIRIHSGNTTSDTEGCIILGATRSYNTITRSKIAFDNFFRKLTLGLHSEKVILEIRNTHHQHNQFTNTL
ncbi:MAG: DUF5675 family protein [bacterium]